MPSSVIFFANEALPSNCVGLGRFVLDPDMPWGDYCPDSIALPQDAKVASDPQLYPIIETGVQRGARIDMEFIRSKAVLFLMDMYLPKVHSQRRQNHTFSVNLRRSAGGFVGGASPKINPGLSALRKMDARYIWSSLYTLLHSLRVTETE